MIEKFEINPNSQPETIGDAITLNIMKKINELIDQRETDREKRDEQIENLKAEIKNFGREIMEYHNLLLKQSVVIKSATEASRESQRLYESLTDSIISINKKLDIK